MKRYIRIILVALLPLALFSCSEEQESDGGNAGQLMLSYEVAGNVMTRADGSSSSEIHNNTETGWEDWNENKIESLCLYVFDTNDSNGKGVLLDDYKEGNAYNLTKACGLTPDNYTSYHLYLVANVPATRINTKITSLSELKNLNIESFSAYNTQQKTFYMDGKWTGETDAVSLTDNGKTKTITVKLNRALAKVCVKVRVYQKSYSGKSEDLTSFDGLTAQFCHYATVSALIEGGNPTPDAEKLSVTTSNDEAISNNVYTGTDGTRMVFYSYANDWFDESKADKMNQVEPVLDARQSYILLTFKGQKFKIPVNYRLPKDNDKKIVWENLTDSEKQSIRQYYQLSRNHVYNVQVSLVEPEDKTYNWKYRIAINDWEDDGWYYLGEDD